LFLFLIVLYIVCVRFIVSNLKMHQKIFNCSVFIVLTFVHLHFCYFWVHLQEVKALNILLSLLGLIFFLMFAV